MFNGEVWFLGNGHRSNRRIFDMPRLKVLVVEDDALVRLCAAELLDEAGFEVLEARNAQEALRALEREREIRVVFTNIGVRPGEDGLELARDVHRQWPDIRLVITSDDSFFAAAELPDCGRFIAKAAGPEVLLKVIEQAAQPR
jgi:DNA-binding NtrC family response regulator